MRTGTLREYIRTLVVERYDSEWEEDSVTAYMARDAEKALEDLGLEVLRSGTGNTAYIGKGSYSEVYEVVYGGRRAVAKITNQREAITYDLCKDLRNRVPKNVASALPAVYKIFKIDDVKKYPALRGTKQHGEAYVVVSEYLEKTTLDVNQFYFGHLTDKNIEQNTEMLKNDVDRLRVAVRMAFKRARLPKAMADDAMPNSKNIELWRKYLDTMNIDNGVPLCAKIMAQIVNDEDFTNTRDVQLVYAAMRKETVGDRFPESHETVATFGARSGAKKNAAPATRALGKFLNSLRWLTKNASVKWYDLHGDNVMVRPSSGEFVAADIGLFGF